MEGTQKIDTVMQHVWQAAKRWGVSSEAVMTQQILLLGNSFFGYRFTTSGFAAIWSAVDQSIKVYDKKEQLLEVFTALETAAESASNVLPLHSLQRAA